MMAANRHNEVSCFTCHRERVKIETAICPAVIINPDDPNNDGLVFAIEGSIRDGDCISGGSGLLVIDNIPGSNGPASGQWNISFYPYEEQTDDCEIKFKLPVYLRERNFQLN
jgi:hypothetical protein